MQTPGYCSVHDRHNCDDPSHFDDLIDRPLTWNPTPGEPYRLQDLTPMRDRLLVAPLAASSRSRGGIHLAEISHQRERPQQGIVLKVGPGNWDPTAQTFAPLQVKPGDCVFYGKYSGQEFTIAERAVLNMAEIEVFSLLPAGTFIVVPHDDPKHNHLQGDYCDICATPAEKEAKAFLDAERARLVAERAGAIGVQDLVPPTPFTLPEAADAPNPLEAERERLREARRAKDAKDEA